ncbi:uncharacterized protein LOC129617721 [Condylostylus longicornis]|uniref:uncharacterized protein LOC129617721 n=1 Tax=Condylostylus longicornis TaxID=2530218 RepID=UPI00244E2B38|nr:uncharacterized protein LOC129617721 [Condylostylus longicornis]
MRSKIFYRFASESTLRELSTELPASAGDIRSQLKKIVSIPSSLDLVVYELNEQGRSSRYVCSDNIVINEGQKLLVSRVPYAYGKSLLKAAIECQAKERVAEAKSAEAVSSKASSIIDHTGLEPVSSDDEDNSLPLLTSQRQTNPERSETASSHPSSSSSLSSSEPPSLYSRPSSQSHLTSSSVSHPIEGVHSKEGAFDPAVDFDEDDDDEETEQEQLKIRKIMLEQQSNEVTSSRSDHHRPRDSLASRYHRNRNLTWSKDSEKESYSQQPRLFSNGRQFEMKRGTGPPNAIVPVHANYVCHICGEKGHHIRNCPKGNDPKRQKKVKPSTGLPRSWLQRISEDEIAQCKCDVYSLPDGTFAILKPTATAASASIAQPVESKVHQRFGDASAAIAGHLRCPLCSLLFNDAVLTPCCGETFCRRCLYSRLSSASKDEVGRSGPASRGSDTGGGVSSADRNNVAGQCPSCQEVIRSDELESNKVIQESVEGVLRVGRLTEAQSSFQANNKVEKRRDVANQSAEQKIVTSLPPGTIRDVGAFPPGVRPIPLGGRLASRKRPFSSTGMSTGTEQAKKQAVR